MLKRYSVLTYIVCDYERVREIEQADPEAEYVLVTDNKALSSATWRVVYDPDLEGLSVFDKCYSIRFNCFKYCNTDICIRIDGSIGLKLSLKPLVDIFEAGKYDVCLMPHPFRYNFKAEYAAWVEQRGYDKEQAKRCLRYMREKGYSFSYKGLFQCGFVIQRRGEITDKIDQMCLATLKELGQKGIIERIDQVPVSFVINKYFSHLKVLPISSQILSSPYMQLYMHGTDEYNLNHLPDITKADKHYMFNRKVECMYMLLSDEEKDKKNAIVREYELLRKINQLQKVASVDFCKRLEKLENKSRKHLRTIRILIAVSIVLAVLLVFVTVVLFLK